MSSDPAHVFVWVWLPGSPDPVVAGVLEQTGGIVTFTYGQTYLVRDDAIALYLPELPLARGAIAPAPGTIAGCIADAAPDAWGMRVVLARLMGREAGDVGQLSPLTYLIESGSDRIGALDFQRSAREYEPRGTGEATLEELMEAADRVQANLPLSPDLDQALLHGSSIGGARPKAVLQDGDRSLIAKFSSNTDTYPVVKGEFISMELAARAGPSHGTGRADPLLEATSLVGGSAAAPAVAPRDSAALTSCLDGSGRDAAAVATCSATG